VELYKLLDSLPCPQTDEEEAEQLKQDEAKEKEYKQQLALARTDEEREAIRPILLRLPWRYAGITEGWNAVASYMSSLVVDDATLYPNRIKGGQLQKRWKLVVQEMKKYSRHTTRSGTDDEAPDDQNPFIMSVEEVVEKYKAFEERKDMKKEQKKEEAKK
jgi:hypothetical protein